MFCFEKKNRKNKPVRTLNMKKKVGHSLARPVNTVLRALNGSVAPPILNLLAADAQSRGDEGAAHCRVDAVAMI